MARSLSLRRLLNDPEFESIRRSVGEFGRSPDNPIPVFGIPGEIHYSSQLRTEAGAALMFHRIRSLGTGQGIVDLYEVLAVDRSVRELLYLSMYSARQSVRAPAGYHLAEAFDVFNDVYGVNFLLSDFPADLDRHVAEFAENLLAFHRPAVVGGKNSRRAGCRRRAGHPQPSDAD